MTLQQRLKRYTPALLKASKAGLTLLLLGVLCLLLIVWVDSISGDALLPLPYLWWAIGLRVALSGVLIRFFPTYRWMIVIISIINEVQLYWLHGRALEGLLW